MQRRCSTPRLLVLALVAVLVGRTAPGRDLRAEPTAAAEAQRLYDQGAALYSHGDYAAALELLQAADRLGSRADVFYALGQTARKLGDCPRAISYYRASLELAPTSAAARATRVQIDRCEAELGGMPTVDEGNVRRASPVDDGRAAGSPSAAGPPLAVAEVASPKVARDLAGGLLVTIGGAVLVPGVALTSRAEILARDASSSLDDYLAARPARAMRIGGALLIGAGALSLVGGCIRYAVMGHRARVR